MSDQASSCTPSDRAEAEKARLVLERTRNKVEIASHLLTTNDNSLLQTVVNITDDELYLMTSFYSDLELRGLEGVVRDVDRQIPTEDQDQDELDEHMEVCRTIQVISSNSTVRKLVRENRRELSPKAMAFVRSGGKYPYGSELSFSQKYHGENDQFAWSKSATAPKTESSRSSSVPKIKRTIKRYEPTADKLTSTRVSNVRRPPTKACNETNAELLKFYNHLQNNAMQVRDHQFQIEKLIKKHLHEEKNVRAEKDKAEAELLACLKEYDEEVGTLQALLERETAEFEEEKRQMVILEENFRVQQILYEQLMAEKLAEYQRELKEKMFIFVCNRAALRIQRYWRAYRERKMAKKKRKGRKGKAGSGGKTAKN